MSIRPIFENYIQLVKESIGIKIDNIKVFVEYCQNEYDDSNQDLIVDLYKASHYRNISNKEKNFLMLKTIADLYTTSKNQKFKEAAENLFNDKTLQINTYEIDYVINNFPKDLSKTIILNSYENCRDLRGYKPSKKLEKEFESIKLLIHLKG